MKAKAASSIIWQARLAPVFVSRAATTPATVVNDLGTFKLHQVPSGVFNPDCLVVLGPGMVISPEKLTVELEEVRPPASFPSSPSLTVPPSACRCTRWKTPWKSNAWVTAPTAPPVGGIAPAYGDRVMKKAILVGWLKQPDVLVERIQFMLDWKLPQMKALYPDFEFTQTAQEMADWLLEVSAPWLDAVCNVSMPSRHCKPKARPCCSKPSWAPAVISSTANTPGSPPPTFPAPTPASVAVCRACAGARHRRGQRPSAPPSVPAPC